MAVISSNADFSKHTVVCYNISIETTVTKQAAVVEAWLSDFRKGQRSAKRIVVGMDCKPSPSEQTNKQVATLALYSRKCLILQLAYMDYLPQALHDFLSDPYVICAAFEADKCVSKLKAEYKLNCSSVVDILHLPSKSYASRLISKFGPKPKLEDLAKNIVITDIEKPVFVCNSNWQARVLSFDQIKYASGDAYVIYAIGKEQLD